MNIERCDIPFKVWPDNGKPPFTASINTERLLRERVPLLIWLYNPWTGKRRDDGDVQSDPHGHLIEVDASQLSIPMHAAHRAKEADKVAKRIDEADGFNESDELIPPMLPRRQNLPRRVIVGPGYGKLFDVLTRALEQAQSGKGHERHSDGQPFHEQPICAINRLHGSIDGALFQASKKAHEARRLPRERAVAELLGAINYLAAAVILVEEGILDEGKKDATQ